MQFSYLEAVTWKLSSRFCRAWPAQHLVWCSCSPPMRQHLLGPLNDAPPTRRVSTPAVENRHHSFPVLCELSALLPLTLSGGVFPCSWQLPHIWAPLAKLNTCEWPSAELQSSLSGPLPYKLQPPWRPCTPRCASSAQGMCWALPGFPVCPVDWELSPGSELKQAWESPLICFPPLRDRWPLRTDTVSWELLFGLFICFSKESTSDPSFSSWPEVEARKVI